MRQFGFILCHYSFMGCPLIHAQSVVGSIGYEIYNKHQLFTAIGPMEEVETPYMGTLTYKFLFWTTGKPGPLQASFQQHSCSSLNPCG